MPTDSLLHSCRRLQILEEWQSLNLPHLIVSRFNKSNFSKLPSKSLFPKVLCLRLHPKHPFYSPSHRTVPFTTSFFSSHDRCTLNTEFFIIPPNPFIIVLSQSLRLWGFIFFLTWTGPEGKKKEFHWYRALCLWNWVSGKCNPEVMNEQAGHHALPHKEPVLWTPHPPLLPGSYTSRTSALLPKAWWLAGRANWMPSLPISVSWAFFLFLEYA